jgi:hypothetical protein
MQQHYQEVRQLHLRGKRSDSLADHFATQLQNFETITPNLFRNSITSVTCIQRSYPMPSVTTFFYPIPRVPCFEFVFFPHECSGL